MTEQNDDKLMQAASRLATEIAPERDLWPAIAEAIEEPAARRWTPMLAQAASAVLLVGATALITTIIVGGQNGPAPTPVVTADNVFEQTAFGTYNLGPGFQDARNSLVAELEVELAKLSAEDRQVIEGNLDLMRDNISQINKALEEDPENILLQERLLRTYREELALLRRVGGLTRNVMLRNDI